MVDCDIMTHPTVYIKELSSIVFFLPIASAVNPPVKVPNMHPMVIRLATEVRTRETY